MRNLLKKIWHIIPRDVSFFLALHIRIFTQKFYASKLRKILSKCPVKSDEVAIVGFFSSSLGHGTATRLLAKELEKSIIKYKVIDISEIHNSPRCKNIELRYDKIGFSDNLILVVNPDILVYTLSKLDINILKNRRVIGYWVWELDTPPQHWRIANGIVHEIWTPSEFSKSSLSKIFDCPIKVLAHPSALEPIDTNISGENWRSSNNIPFENFVVFQSFSFASSMTRKNIIGAIEAFEMAFGEDKSATLVIRYSGEINFPKALTRLKGRINISKSNIKLIKSNGDINDVWAAYKGADCYISLHRGEGFGLNLSEAMLFGIPLITTNWSSNMDFMTNETCALVDCKLIDVHDPDGIYNVKGAKWAEPDIKMASNFLLRMRNDKKWRLKLIENASIYVKEKLSGIDLKGWLQ